MDALPLRQAKIRTSLSQQLSPSKASQSQTTNDLYLRPGVKVKHGQNDIRKYFPPVARTKASSYGETRKTSSPIKMPAMPKPCPSNGAAKAQTWGLSPSLRTAADSIAYIAKNGAVAEGAPGAFVRAGNHNYSRSAVLPSMDPFFDDEFPHSTSAMAPRVTDAVRYSLVPKPLNIKVPPPAAEASRSPSQTTCSPSSVEDLDTASLDEERREVPSFKQTYSRLHSRHHTNDSPVSPLIALRDPNVNSLRQHRDRPATSRSRTAPKRLEPYPTDSVIYFLPKVSPTSDSSADEWEPLIKTSHSKPMSKASIRDKSKAESRAVKLEDVSPAQIAKKRDALKERDVTVSPGTQTPSALRLRTTTDFHRTPTLLRIPCIS